MQKHAKYVKHIKYAQKQKHTKPASMQNTSNMKKYILIKVFRFTTKQKNKKTFLIKHEKIKNKK